MQLSDVDLLDPDVFRTGQHHEMFRLLRAEDPCTGATSPTGRGSGA